MLVNRTTEPGSAIAIPQTSHAFMAWQLAEHWGNRRFARPAPRAEALAGVLLHDSGWTDFDGAPGLDDTGTLRTFDSMTTTDHLKIWRASVLRAGQHSRYSALLVASHFARLAERKASSALEHGHTDAARAVQAARAELEGQCSMWREQLARDARYERALEGAGFAVNVSLLTACDAISVYLCSGRTAEFQVMVMATAGGEEAVTISPLGGNRWRVRPWPLMGDRVRLVCEGKRLAATRFDAAGDAAQALARAPTARLGFVLLRAAARG